VLERVARLKTLVQQARLDCHEGLPLLASLLHLVVLGVIAGKLQLNPERNGGHDPFTIDGDQYFTRRALQSIRAEPGVYVAYSLKKTGYFWLGNPAAEWGYFDFCDWATLCQWYPYSSLRLLNMFMARQLPLIALVALVFLASVAEFGPCCHSLWSVYILCSST
jgi:hypothetical protein